MVTIRTLAAVGLALLLTRGANAQAPVKKAAQEPTVAEVKKDLERIREMNEQLISPVMVQSRPESDEVKEFLANLPAFEEDLQRLEAKYGKVIKTKPFRDLAGALNHRRIQLGAVRAAATAYASAAAVEFEFAEALRLTDEAVAKGHVVYFGPGGSVTQRLAWAKQKLAVLTALAPASADAKAAAAKLQAAGKKVVEQQAALAEQIVAANQPPPDRYRGPDREALLGVLRDTWTKAGTGAVPLKIGIVGEAWKRRVAWEWRAQAWHKSDSSKIQGFVLVALDDKIAVRHAINLVKDHQSGDKVTAHFVDDPKQPSPLIDRILLSKLK